MLVASPPSTLSSPPRSPAADDTLVRTTSQRGGPRPGLNRTHLTFGSPSSSYFPSSTSSSAVSSTSSTPTIQPATHHHPRSRSIPEPLNESEPLLSTAGLLLAPTGGRPLPALRRHKSLNNRPTSQPPSSLLAPPPPPLPFPRSPGQSTTTTTSASKHLPPNRVFHLLHNPPAPTPIPPRLLQTSFIRRSTGATPSISGGTPFLGGGGTRSRTNSVGSSSGGTSTNTSSSGYNSGNSSDSSSIDASALGSISSSDEEDEDDVVAVKEEEESDTSVGVVEEEEQHHHHHRRGGSLGGGVEMKLNGLCL